MTPDELRARRREYKRRWRAKYPEKHRAENKKYYSPEYRRRWETANPDKVAAHHAKSRLVNRAKRNYYLAGYKARKLQATPKWADLFAVHEFYKEAIRLSKETGVEHHVDHIVPLQSELVCGLHCEANLRVIPATENYKKNNRVWPDMPDDR